MARVRYIPFFNAVYPEILAHIAQKDTQGNKRQCNTLSVCPLVAFSASRLNLFILFLIVFKLHPEMLADIAQKDAVKAMKDNATRYIKTTSRALVEHLCKYLAMRIALDLAKTTSSSSQPQSTEGGGGGLAAAAPPSSEPPTSVTTSDGTSSASSAAAASASTTATSTGGSVKDLTIFIASVPGQLTPLTPSLSLTQVNEKYWKVNKPLEMFYRFTRV